MRDKLAYRITISQQVKCKTKIFIFIVPYIQWFNQTCKSKWERIENVWETFIWLGDKQTEF